MATEICIYGCEAIRVASVYPSNGNHIRLSIPHRGETLELSMFDLPEAITMKLMLAFGDESTRHNLPDEKQEAA